MTDYYARGALITTYQVTCAACEAQLQLGHRKDMKRASKLAREAGWGTFGKWGWYCPTCLPYARNILEGKDADSSTETRETAHEAL